MFRTLPTSLKQKTQKKKKKTTRLYMGVLFLFIVSCMYKFLPHMDQCEVRGQRSGFTHWQCSRCKVSKRFLVGCLRFTTRLEHSIVGLKRVRCKHHLRQHYITQKNIFLRAKFCIIISATKRFFLLKTNLKTRAKLCLKDEFTQKYKVQSLPVSSSRWWKVRLTF